MKKKDANLIAIHQSRRFNSKLNELRYRKLGATKYIWRTQKDIMVLGHPQGPYSNYTPSHHAREGKVFNFNKKPKDGNPGEALHCRCYAEPIFDNLFED